VFALAEEREHAGDVGPGLGGLVGLVGRGGRGDGGGSGGGGGALGGGGFFLELLAGELDLDGALVITPGDPARSVLSQRLRATGDARMPPLGSVRIDEQGAALVDAWIESLATCP
jgi:hypothetical protein